MSQYIFYHIRVFELEDCSVSIFIHFSAIVFKIYVALCNVTLVIAVYIPKTENKYLQIRN